MADDTTACTDDDLEQFAGEEIPDPWADKTATDWPNRGQLVDPEVLNG